MSGLFYIYESSFTSSNDSLTLVQASTESPSSPTFTDITMEFDLEIELRTYSSSQLNIQVDPESLWLPYPLPRCRFAMLSELDLPDLMYVGRQFQLPWMQYQFRVRNIYLIGEEEEWNNEDEDDHGNDNEDEIAAVRIVAIANLGFACIYVLFDYPKYLVIHPDIRLKNPLPYIRPPPYSESPEERPEYRERMEDSDEEMSE